MVISVDFKKVTGEVKPMHATNNGPIRGIGFGAQKTNGFEDWKESGIPYVRTHDSSFCANYGGEHTVDINAVFPDFDADVNSESSYDFKITDNYFSQIYSCNSKVFYRLGSKIEHEVKKYNTLPPKDFKKWAQICEHIIMHYTEGWANGFNYDMEYWEIWNEPDLDLDDSDNKRTWGGTKLEFFEFYKVASLYLKKRFPHLKIGGPASSYRWGWMQEFIEFVARENLPLDFFSWHCYTTRPEEFKERNEYVRKWLGDAGLNKTESILNEWNYVRDWNDFIYSLKQIISLKGAAFTASCMLLSQNDTSIDMLMYYDARPSHYNGLFDFYTNERLKGYYPFLMFNSLYKLKNACECSVSGSGIYAAAATNGAEKAVMFSLFTDDDADIEKREVTLNFKDCTKQFEVLLLDEENDAKSVMKVRSGEKLTLSPNSVCLLKSL